MARREWLPKVTPAEAEELFWLTFKDDGVESPCEPIDDLQFWSISGFAQCLRDYGRRQGRGWYVAAMLPLSFRWRGQTTTYQVAPDVFVAFASDHPRTSFDTGAEAGSPPFALEVLTTASRERDESDRQKLYGLLEVREYALFWPRLGEPSSLTGFCRDENGQFVTWKQDRAGRLWSEVLGLSLFSQGMELRAQTADGRLLPTLEDAEAARQQAEAENARLRHELERLRSAPTR